MPKSARFRILCKELNRLKKQFIPSISPTGFYSERQLARTLAYRVLAHAEIESYLEERVWEVVLNVKRNWDSSRKAHRTLICLIAFSGQSMDKPPSTLTPTRGSRTHPEEKVKIDKKLDLAIKSFKRVIDENHGVKEANILALLLPIGIDSDDLDSSLLATMNTFGEQRGQVAHSSATTYRTNQPPDPATEVNTVKQIIQGLLQVDELINNLMK
ncbi:HEPN domain-containing protein [Floridanema aerugineum]|uniref:HEPN domain-containing protein n=1 Tax=Floridaenema aerugineum BLCC-F46 TaxID=3153654 RepID=A0ABV4X921_9CYAN